MKNIIKSITLLLVMALSVTSCILDDDNLSDTFSDGPNFTSFANLSQTVSAVADGNLVGANINIILEGPNMVGYTEDVTLGIEVDAANTTAIEGVHYTINSTSLTLTESNNYIGTLPISIITEGIEPPLDVAPILTFKFSNANGTNVIPSSKSTELTIIYQCFADMAGTYLVTNSLGCVSKTTTITKAADGSWALGTADGFFLDSCTSNAGFLNGGNIVELCGEILPTGNLAYGFLGIGTIAGGTWDAENGILTLNNLNTWTTNFPADWVSTYVRQ